MLRSAGYRHKTDGLPMVLIIIIVFFISFILKFQVKTYASIGSLWKTLMLIIGFMIIIPMSLTGFGAKLLLKVGNRCNFIQGFPQSMLNELNSMS